MKKLLFGKLEKDKVYTINVEHQVVVQPRTLPTGVTPTGNLTMNELKECAKKHLQVTDAENNMTMTESDFIGLCSFEDKYDLMVDKKESVLNLNEKNENISSEETMHDRSFTSTNNISIVGNQLPSVFNTIPIIKDNQVNEKIPSFELNESLVFNIPVKERHIKQQIENNSYQKSNFSNSTDWNTDPDKKQILLNYRAATPDPFENSVSIKVYLQKHHPEYVKDLQQIKKVLIWWREKNVNGFTRRSDLNLTEGQMRLMSHGPILMNKFMQLENHERIGEIREGVLYCLIHHFEFLQGNGLGTTLNYRCRHHETRQRNEAAFNVFRRVIFEQRPEIRDLLFHGNIDLCFVTRSSTCCKVFKFVKLGMKGKGSEAWTKNYLETVYAYWTRDI